MINFGLAFRSKEIGSTYWCLRFNHKCTLDYMKLVKILDKDDTQVRIKDLNSGLPSWVTSWVIPTYQYGYIKDYK